MRQAIRWVFGIIPRRGHIDRPINRSSIVFHSWPEQNLWKWAMRLLSSPVRLASDSADTMARSTMVEPARTASTSLRRSRGDRCAVPAASSGRSLGFSHMNEKARPSTSGAALGHETFFTQMGALSIPQPPTLMGPTKAPRVCCGAFFLHEGWVVHCNWSIVIFYRTIKIENGNGFSSVPPL
jgi:hypothetical protein